MAKELLAVIVLLVLACDTNAVLNVQGFIYDVCFTCPCIDFKFVLKFNI